MKAMVSTIKSLARWLNTQKRIHVIAHWPVSPIPTTTMLAMFLLSVCDVPSGFSQTDVSPDTKSHLRWKEVLAPLNATSQESLRFPSYFSHPSSVDLTDLNRQEMQDIKQQWKLERDKETARPKRSPPSERNQVRTAENIFFHSKINTLNQATFSRLTSAAKIHEQESFDFSGVADLVIQGVATNPVANLAATQRYDPTKQIGFCFGRALLVHKLMMDAGVNQTQMAKIFVLGELMHQRQHWLFHVAVMVRDTKNGFLVVDPLQGKPLPYKEWIAITSRYDIKGKYSRARFYVTEPGKFLPSFANHSLAQLQDPTLKKYFEDLLLTLK
jgi:hypothetical protein